MRQLLSGPGLEREGEGRKNGVENLRETDPFPPFSIPFYTQMSSLRLQDLGGM